MDMRHGGEIEGAGNLRGDPQGVGHRRGPVQAQGNVERLGFDEFFDEVRRVAEDAGRERPRDRGMRQLGADETVEIRDELVHELRREIDREQFDRDRTIVLGIVATKHGTQRAGANLMNDAEWTERFRSHRSGRFRAQ